MVPKSHLNTRRHDKHLISGDGEPPDMATKIMRYLGHVSALGILYFLASQLSLQIHLPEGPASPIWPPAGIALGILLIGGWRMWPAIFLGSFFADPMFALTATHLLSAGFYAVGTLVQAAVGVLFAAPYFRRQTLSVNAGDEWKFLLAIGPIACLLSPTVGLTARHLLDLIPESELSSQWLIWWAGDTLGAILFIPLLLHIWIRKTRPSAPVQGFYLPLVATFLILIAGSLGLSALESAQQKNNLSKQLHPLLQLNTLKLKEQVSYIASVERLFAASEGITAEEFERFNHKIINEEGIIRIDWAPRVTGPERASLEQRTTGMDTPEFPILETTAAHKKMAARPRDDYYPIRFSLYSSDYAFDPIGLDHGAPPARRRALQKAIATGNPTAHITELETDGNRALMLFFPHFRDDAPPDTENLDIREAAVMGFVVGVIDPHNLFAITDHPSSPKNLSYRITSQGAHGTSKVLLNTLPPSTEPNWVQNLTVADLAFKLEIAAGTMTNESQQRWIYLALAMMATFLVALTVLTNRSYQEKRIQQQQELQDSRELLNAIIESCDIQIAAFDNKLRLTAFNRACEEFMHLRLNAHPYIGQPADHFFPDPEASERHGDTFSNNMHKALEGKRIKVLKELDIVGKTYTYEIRFNPVYSTDGGIIGATYVARDITPDIKLESQLKKQLEELTRWKQATLEREPLVLELKGEINQLLQRLGQPPRYQHTGKK